MKLYRNAIILVVIVALLVGAYFLVSNIKPKESTDSGAASDVVKLTDYTTDQVESVTLKNPDGTFVITQKDTEWVLASPTDFKPDSSVLSSIFINACSVTGDKLVEENAKDLSVYGLDNPVTVTVKEKKSGTEKTIEVGNLTPTKGGYYIKLAGENKVYVLGSYTGDSLVTRKNAMRSKELLGVTPDMFTKLSMDRKGANVFSSELDPQKSGNWNILSPIKGSANSSALQPMFEALAGTTIKEFIEDKPADLSKYGLDKPSYSFDLDTTTGGAFKLLLGDEKTKGSEMYAKLDGKDEVFTIDSSALTFLDKPLKEIIDVFAYIVNIDQVTRIDLTMNGKTDVMTLDVFKDAEGKSDADKDKFTFNGKDATGKDADDKQPFRTFYQALIGVSLDEVDLSGATPADVNPDITINYTLKTGSMKVDYVSKDANYYYVFRNGEYAKILVRKSGGEFATIAGLKKDYQTMVDFLAKQ